MHFHEHLKSPSSAGFTNLATKHHLLVPHLQAFPSTRASRKGGCRDTNLTGLREEAGIKAGARQPHLGRASSHGLRAARAVGSAVRRGGHGLAGRDEAPGHAQAGDSTAPRAASPGGARMLPAPLFLPAKKFPDQIRLCFSLLLAQDALPAACQGHSLATSPAQAAWCPSGALDHWASAPNKPSQTVELPANVPGPSSRGQE